MALLFNADEIFEMAEQIERNGSHYYRKAAATDIDPAIKQLLNGLAVMEDRHQQTFADLRKQLSDKARQPTVFDPEGESAAYLRALADGSIFDPDAAPADRLTGRESPEEILKKAIELEKDSIVFYLGVKDMVTESLGKDRIDHIIQEEMNHIAMLSDQLRNLKRTN